MFAGVMRGIRTSKGGSGWGHDLESVKSTILWNTRSLTDAKKWLYNV